jgi:twitching motility protein PilT
MDLDQLLIELGQHGGSDLHLKGGRPPIFRIHGDLYPQTGFPEITQEEMRDTLYRLMGPERARIFEQELEADFSYEIPNFARFRVNTFVQRGQIGAVMRLIPLEVPAIETLALPPVMRELCDCANGLVLVTGPTGSGKSTSLAAMVNYINKKYPRHIITIEDPIEFVHSDETSVVNQRELGLDTHELHRALRAALRQDPDVILMGEMRDPDTIHFAITAAETGHLVFSTLHTNDAKQSLDRILGTFEGAEANQVRMQLALVLRGILCQRLIKRADGQGRVAAIEILINTSHVKQIIEEGATRDLEKAIMEGAHHAMQTFNDALFELYRSGQITEEEALGNSATPDDLKLLMRGVRKGSSAEELATEMGLPRGGLTGARPASPGGARPPSSAGGARPPGSPGGATPPGGPSGPKPSGGGAGGGGMGGGEKKPPSRGFGFQ